jgi:hypothetical protein
MRNLLVDFNAGIERPRDGRVLDNRDIMLLGQFADRLGQKILTLCDQCRDIHVVKIVFQRDRKPAGRKGPEWRRAQYPLHRGSESRTPSDHRRSELRLFDMPAGKIKVLQPLLISFKERP